MGREIDYSWIKAGVKAELVRFVGNSILNGQQVTISSCAYMLRGDLVVAIEEGYELASLAGCDGYRLAVELHQLKPIKGDEMPDWNAIATSKTVPLDELAEA